MKLEVGMYVRTDKGELGKIIKIEKGYKEKLLYFFNIDLPNYAHIEEEFTKASHNIINIIQSKDLIIDTKNNLYVVDRVEGDYVFTTSKNEHGLIITLVDYQIKSIVTKEQFQSINYEVR